jgi:short-subunit dehydrogenase
MSREIAGLRTIVTGASSGIGRAVATALAAGGAKVAVAARSADKLREIAGGTMLAVPTDLTVPADRERLVATVVREWGGLDALVNNAGVASWGHFQTSTEDINRRVMELNFFAPVELTRLAIPHLERGRQPVVVNVTSMCGRRGMPAWPEYSASKFALIAMCEAWRAEFVRFGVDVVTVVPGLTRSEFSQHYLRNDGRADIPHDRGMTSEYVAERVVRAIRSNSREVVLGGEAKKIILMNRFFPRWLDRLIARRITKLYT